MTPRAQRVTAVQAIRVPESHGFEIVRQKGNHAIMRNEAGKGSRSRCTRGGGLWRRRFERHASVVNPSGAAPRTSDSRESQRGSRPRHILRRPQGQQHDSPQAHSCPH